MCLYFSYPDSFRTRARLFTRWVCGVWYIQARGSVRPPTKSVRHGAALHFPLRLMSADGGMILELILLSRRGPHGCGSMVARCRLASGPAIVTLKTREGNTAAVAHLPFCQTWVLRPGSRAASLPGLQRRKRGESTWNVAGCCTFLHKQSLSPTRFWLRWAVSLFVGVKAEGEGLLPGSYPLVATKGRSVMDRTVNFRLEGTQQPASDDRTQ
jgi:hypothetical protein